MVSILASRPAALGLTPSFPKKFSGEKIVDVAEDNQQGCLQDCGQWLENVDWAHLVLYSGKAVLKNDSIMLKLERSGQVDVENFTA